MFYWFVKHTLRPLMRVLFRPVVTGAHHIPAAGGAVLASNHLSMCDSLFLPVLTRRRMTFLAKQEYFSEPGLRGRAKAAFVRGTGLIPLDRGNAGSADRALSTGVRVLRRGALLGVYPEGTRSPDGRLYRGKTGVARMALQARVPVIPVAMIGTDAVQPIGRTWPSLRRVQVRIGAPISAPEVDGDPHEQARALTEQVMTAIARLSGQQRADTDAATHKAQLSARQQPVQTG